MSVKVAVRVRPFNTRQKNLGCTCVVDMKDPQTILKAHQGQSQRPFTFDYSFWSFDQFEQNPADGYLKPTGSKYADQKIVYDKIGNKILDNAFEGYHCCLFAYGQTGSGKSYSMIGYGSNKGIVPITCNEIFERINKNKSKPGTQFEVYCSMIQIYNEEIQDLTIPTSKRPKEGLKVRQNKLLGIYVEGMKKNFVKSYQEIEDVMEEGTKNRTVAATQMNATSSRAHTIITIQFKQITKQGQAKSEKISLINLVDLAGSERQDKTQATGQRLKQAVGINQSLTNLGQVISTLADNAQGGNKFVPYRNSALTRILQNALGGNSQTVMICAISPANDNYDETLSTLRYADRAKKIQNKPVVNETAQDKMIRQLKEENQRLKKILQKQGKDPNIKVVEDNNNNKQTEQNKAKMQQQLKKFEQQRKKLEQQKKLLEQQKLKLQENKNQQEQDNKNLQLSKKQLQENLKQLQLNNMKLEENAKRQEEINKKQQEDNKKAYQQNSKKLQQQLKKVEQQRKKLQQQKKLLQQQKKKLEDNKNQQDQDNKSLQQRKKQLEQIQKKLQLNNKKLEKTNKKQEKINKKQQQNNKKLQKNQKKQQNKNRNKQQQDEEEQQSQSQSEEAEQQQCSSSCSSQSSDGLDDSQRQLDNDQLYQKLQADMKQLQLLLQEQKLSKKEKQLQAEKERKLRQQQQKQMQQGMARIFRQKTFQEMEKKGQIPPYFQNIAKDFTIHRKLRILVQKDRMTVGKMGANPPNDIVFGGRDMKMNHAIIQKVDKKVFLRPVTEFSHLYVNGKQVTKPIQLMHLDRVIFGWNSVYLFKNKDDKRTDQTIKDKAITWQFCKKEVFEYVDIDQSDDQNGGEAGCCQIY